MKRYLAASAVALSGVAFLMGCESTVASRDYDSRGFYDSGDVYRSRSDTYTYRESVPQPVYTVPQPTYTTPQPTYPNPQPIYTNPAPAYPQPRPEVVAVAPSRSIPQAVGDLRLSMNGVLGSMREFGHNNYPVLTDYLRDMDEKVIRLEDAVNDRDRPQRVRVTFGDVQRSAANIDNHLQTHNLDNRIRDAWFRVRGAVQEVDDAINYRY